MTDSTTNSRTDPAADRADTSLPASAFPSLTGAEFIVDIVENMKDVVFRTDATGFWTYLNPAWTEITGCSVRESLGTLYLDYIHPDDHERIINAFQPLVAGEKKYSRQELRYLHRDGTYRWMEAYAHLTVDGDGNMTGTSGTLTDISERVAARNALNENRSRLASIIESALDCIISIDRDQKIVEFNPAAERTFGYRREDVIGRFMPDLIVPPSLRQFHNEAFERFLHTHEGANLGRLVELPAMRADGSEFPAETMLCVDERVDGHPLFTAYLRDISERKRAEEARSKALAELEAANSFRQHVTDAAPFLIYVFDTTRSQMTYINNHVQNLLGYTPDDVYAIRGQLIETLVHPEDRAAIWAHLAQVAKRKPEEGYVQIEYRMRHANGEWRWFRIRDTVFQRSETGVVLEALGVAEDITETRAAAAALRESQERYEVAVRGSTDCIWDCNLLTGEIFQSDRWGEIFGYEPHEMPKNVKEWIAMLHPDDVARVQDTRNAYLRGEANVYRAEYRCRCKDGSYRWVLTRGSALRTPDGVPYRLAGSLTDISERRAAAERERQLTQELQRSNRELNDFASVVSHDLQEPLRKIRMFGDLLRDDTGNVLTADSIRYMASIGKAAVRMQALINDLLTFSRLTTKHKAPVQVDLNRVVSDVSADLEARIAETGGRIEVCGKLPEVQADPMQMRQLFQNLLGNALKFNQPDIPPVVTICSGQERPASDDDPGTVWITVSDNGIGFEQEYAGQIFGVFERLHGVGKYEGTGMGLAICRKIVERHGGAISAQSSPGHGAKFTMTLPAAAARNQTEKDLSEGTM